MPRLNDLLELVIIKNVIGYSLRTFIIQQRPGKCFSAPHLSGFDILNAGENRQFLANILSTHDRDLCAGILCNFQHNIIGHLLDDPACRRGHISRRIGKLNRMHAWSIRSFRDLAFRFVQHPCLVFHIHI